MLEGGGEGGVWRGGVGGGGEGGGEGGGLEEECEGRWLSLLSCLLWLLWRLLVR